ncbi:hypothetical protein HP398_00620 [Brevibacillus sp. HB1.4B]|uniref:hypothetical protein n=1 Tax=Brevibacillus sp. HB1.4B TaxID=2738845 RepID=UPI00156A9AE9|nr:hypothetical protein [Brevibacillus sp. HB1.4B]NRS14935.1 hypothetical protein [Brevibacillus sp. HB1.4B]
MNNRSNAYEKIVDFLASSKKALLLTGTHQYEKHPLILKAIKTNVEKPSTVLFRANSMKNLDAIFNTNKQFKTGTAYKFGNHQLFIDSINPSSWKTTKRKYDYAILYPFDSTIKGSSFEKVMEDLYTRRDINKIFLVSWTDNVGYDYRKMSQFYDEHVIFDALEEKPDYHQRVLDVISR